MAENEEQIRNLMLLDDPDEGDQTVDSDGQLPLGIEDSAGDSESLLDTTTIVGSFFPDDNVELGQDNSVGLAIPSAEVAEEAVGQQEGASEGIPSIPGSAKNSHCSSLLHFSL